MFCGNCGVQIADNAAFCPNCGAQVEKSGSMQPASDQAVNGFTSPENVMPGTPVPQAYDPAVDQAQAYQQIPPAQPIPQPAKRLDQKAQKKAMIGIAVYSVLALVLGAFFALEANPGIAALVGIVPSIIILVLIYRLDSVEKEPVKLIIKLFIGGGILSLIIALIGELVFGYVLNAAFGVVDTENPELSLGGFYSITHIIYELISNFICVAIIEEFAKYIVLKKFSWKNQAFDFLFDGVVYSVATAIGFEVIENIVYIFGSGAGMLGTAILRTAFPGHAIFGIYMGYYYGKAKSLEVNGDPAGAKKLRIKGILIATAIHGLYDFLCSFDTLVFFIGIIPLVVVLNVFAFKNVIKYQGEDATV